jgi:glutathione synthase/RimK-type ligase-like ATP-grasp enzyme
MTKLKIGILTTNPTGAPAKAFETEIVKQGHEAVIISAADAWCLISEANGHDRIYTRSKDDDKSQRIFSKDLDGIIVRLSGGRASYSLNVLRHFANQDIFCTLTDYSIMTSSDKFWLSQIASRNRVRVPRQILSVDPKDHNELINAIDPIPPIFAKMVHGSEGKGCFVIPDAINGKMFLESMEAAGQPVILQRHLTKKAEKRREDHRIWCIGAETDNPIFSAMTRISTSNDPRTNWSIHHQAEAYEPTEEEKQMCIKISKAIGGGVIACDTMLDLDNKQYYLIESNSNPGLGIRDIVKPDKDPVKLTVEYVVKNCKRPKPNKAFWDNIGAASTNGLDNLNLSIDMKQPNFQRFIKEATSLGFSEATSINLLKMALVTTF